MRVIFMRCALLPIVFFLTIHPLQAQKKPEKKYPTLLWEITGNGLKKPSYLFGTMHVSSKMVFHLSDSFYFGIKNSDVVALELDPQLWQDQLFRFQNLQTNLRFYTQGSPNDYLNEKSFQLEKYEEKLRAALSEEPTIINGLLYRTVQPRADFEEDTYLDLYIYQTGKRFGKQATGVENYFETEKLILEATQDMMKDKKKRTTDTDGESIYEIEKKTQEAYRKGDLDLLDSLEKLMQTSDAYMEKFLYKRNEIQANSIDSIVKKHSLFVGVGAAHLPGKRGVIELLRKKGYVLRPISMQDKDSQLRDDIEKVKVPVTFSSFISDDGRFSVQAPGKLYKRADGRFNDSWQYADMSNGTYYMVSRVKTHSAAIGNNEDVVLKKVDSLLYENIPGKIIKKTTIIKNGCKGFDITNKTRRGDLQRYNILVTPFEVLVFKMSGTGAYIDGKEADLFFNSISVKRDAGNDWVNFSPDRGGFWVRFPQQPFQNKDNTGFDGVPRWEYESYDSTNGDAYLVWKRTIQNYRFLEEDSFDLNLMEESFHLSDYVDKQLSKSQSLFKGYPSLDALYLLKDGSYIKAKFLLDGPQYFLLAVHTKHKEKPFSPFFDSFSLAPYTYSGFKNYIDTFVNIKVQTPVVPDIDVNVRSIVERSTSEEFLNSIPDYNNYWPRNKTALFQDDSTGEAVYVSVQTFPKYYYPKDSLWFWNDETNEKKIRQDFIIKNKQLFRFNDSVYGVKYIFADTNSSRLITNWIFLKDNKLYRVMSLDDSLPDKSEFINRFYESIKPTEKRSGNPVFENKLDIFFKDFYSKDSATSKKAKDAIPNVYFGAKGVPLLLKAISSLQYNDKDYFATKVKLINELGYISDSPVVKQVIAGLKNIYEKTADTSTFQNAVLRALAKLKTKESYELFKTMIMQDPPVFDNSSDYSYLFQDLNDSLALTRSLFPDLMQLMSVDDYKDNVQGLLTTLVDSGYLKANDYDSYFSKLLFDAKIQLKKQQARDEQQLQKNDDDNSTSQYSDAEKSNDDDYSDLENYAVVLMPFYDKNASVPHFFDKLLQSKDANLRLGIAVLLLRNNKKVPDSTILNLAANDKYRWALFRKLKAINKEDKFPRTYFNQLAIAKSQLAGTRQAKDIFAIEYVDKQLIQFKQEKGYVFFFRYKMNKDDDWQMGISGLQPANGK
ncbi:MAG: TraB/GumN family protein, partial [Bacteroidetes bacterium]|nr:TraB/GumN family protein [Bacteroidota bacterium]